MLNELESPERAAKAVLIESLYDCGLIDSSTVIVPEMALAWRTRRVDLAVANGHLHGYEIKTEADSLRRLAGQVEVYRDHFEAVTVVAHPRHIPNIRKIVTKDVGIAELSGSSVQTIRRPRYRKMTGISAVRLLTMNEMRSALRSCGLPSKGDRNYLEEIMLGQPTSWVRQVTLQSIKTRFAGPFGRFEQQRLLTGTLNAMPLLSRDTHRGPFTASPDLSSSTPARRLKLQARDFSGHQITIIPRRT